MYLLICFKYHNVDNKIVLREVILLNRSILTIGIISLLVSISVIPSSISIAFYGDTTPPITTMIINGTLGDNNWYVSDVNVTLDATDDESGVKETYYKLDDDEWNVYNGTFTVSTDGVHTIYYYSIDNANNTEDIKSDGVAIDQTKPDFEINLEFLDNNPLNLIIKFEIYGEDKTSGVERVELHFEYQNVTEIVRTWYNPPYEYMIHPERTVAIWGFIFPPTIAIDVEFRSIFVGIKLGRILPIGLYVKSVAYDYAGNIDYGTITSGEPPSFTHWKFFKHFTLPNDYSGFIGNYYIDAVFHFEREELTE